MQNVREMSHTYLRLAKLVVNKRSPFIIYIIDYKNKIGSTERTLDEVVKGILMLESG